MPKNDKIKKNEAKNLKKNLSDLKPYILNLEAEFENDQVTPSYISRLNGILNMFNLEHLHLKINSIRYYIDYVRLDFRPDNFDLKHFDEKNFDAIENLHSYKEISITWNYSTGSNEDSRWLIEWMSSPNWAKNRIKKNMIFKNSFRLTGFVETYIKFFLETKNPNDMFKNVLIQTDVLYEYGPGPSYHGCGDPHCGIPQYSPMEIPGYFRIGNNIIHQKNEIKENEEGYKELFGNYKLAPESAIERFEIKRDDGYILRIMEDKYNNERRFQQCESLMFTISQELSGERICSEFVNFSVGPGSSR
uniref:Uncharacterized protein n=1 Tax=Acrobeloides nanus TaxID=290746 RepID=A0A914CLU3_9BILA